MTREKRGHIVVAAFSFTSLAIFSFLNYIWVFKVSSSYLQEVLSALDSDASLDVLDHPVLNLIYYMVMYFFVGSLMFSSMLEYDFISFPFDKNSLLRSFHQLWFSTSYGSCLPREYQHNITLSVSQCTSLLLLISALWFQHQI